MSAPTRIYGDVVVEGNIQVNGDKVSLPNVIELPDGTDLVDRFRELESRMASLLEPPT